MGRPVLSDVQNAQQPVVQASPLKQAPPTEPAKAVHLNGFPKGLQSTLIESASSSFRCGSGLWTTAAA